MLPRRTLVLILLAVLLCGIVAYALYANQQQRIELPEPNYVGTTTPIVSPTTIRIPKIDVVASIQHVGLTTAGNMAVPTNYEDAGWYRHGAAPGEEGNAVIAGHLDTGGGKPAVFSNLELLRPGDEIFVQDETGETARFLVERVQVYDYDDDPTEVFGESDETRLNLITCDGIWNADKKMYDKRLVVFAVAVPESSN